ncbi:MAG: DUF362 domain-containing protein [Calditrichaeota bacterium]|nr:MAG: DUF362 domain-containing protein [Calditrichota bacterium]
MTVIQSLVWIGLLHDLQGDQMFSTIKNIDSRIFRRCPQTGRIVGIQKRNPGYFLLPLLGFFSLIWFLLRVIPKPSRAQYPCMKIAMPFASGFVIYAAGLYVSFTAFAKARLRFANRRYLFSLIFIIVGLLGSLIMVTADRSAVLAEYYHDDFTPNAPIGEAHGIFPGRVVWIWDADATNEKCSNASAKDDGWFMPQNNNQPVIDRMLSDAVQTLTGKSTDGEAWDAVFHFNNRLQGKGDVGYQVGEIIYIKTNATSSWGGNYDEKTLAIKKNNSYGIAETNPHLVLALLRQLVNVAGVDQQDIYIGDPLKHVYKHCYDLWIAEFPNINVIDNNTSRMGRLKIVSTDEPVMKYSDRGTVMFTGDWNDPEMGDPTEEDFYCQVAEICDYLINVPTMKGHKRAGITMFAKNHFGSHMRENAVHLHGGLVDPTETGEYGRYLRNQYRVQVDLMGHEMHYKRGLFYLMDALYSGSEATDPPRKFKMAPFNNDWASSIFLSLDPVAIESVGYDFLRTEYHENSAYPYAAKPAVDDYLHQAADKSEWPEGIVYDPENDGVPIPSLGVHEHWNNAADKLYSRNLGTGDGIELLKITGAADVENRWQAHLEAFYLHQNYPNPFNASTTIRFELTRAATVTLQIVALNGATVFTSKSDLGSGPNQLTWNGRFNNGLEVPSGLYIYRLMVNDGDTQFEQAKQMIMLK